MAVFGPQTAYFAPQLLDVDVHGPGSTRGPRPARISLYVLLGHGRDYAWGHLGRQDIIDTFAVPLCEPTGPSPRSTRCTTASTASACRSTCSRRPTTGRQPGRRHAARLGDAPRRAHQPRPGHGARQRAGKPVAYTKLRATYFHEADSALGFVELNDPSQDQGEDFQRAASKIGFTFNWFYADHSHIAYFNSGNNPVRTPRTSSHFPVSSSFEWRNWNPDLWTARYTPAGSHPQAVDQRFFANWNNKQARGYRAADDNFSYGSIYRSQSLADRIRRGIREDAKMSITELIDAMEDAGTVDLPRDEGAAVRAADARPAARRAAARGDREAARVGARRRPPPRP